MYKLSRRKNIIPFICLVALGLAATLLVPPYFPEQVFEIPAFALFPAEIALVMMLAVLFFENATPAELLRLAFTMLALAMVSGGMCNVFSRSSQTLPDQTLLLNWVQLICMNVTGLICTIAFYQTKAPALHSVKPAPGRESADAAAAAATASASEAAPKIDFAPEKMEVANGESAKDILGKLDVNRINSLEDSLKAQTSSSNGSVSLESLFADESHAAQDNAPAAGRIEETRENVSLDDWLVDSDSESSPAAQTKADKIDEPAPPLAPPRPEPALQIEPTPAVESAKPVEPTLFTDVSGDLEDIFSDLAPAGAQQDFTPEKLAAVKPEPIPTPAPPQADPQTAAAKAEPKLFDDVSDDIDDIFNSLAAGEPVDVPPSNEASKLTPPITTPDSKPDATPDATPVSTPDPTPDSTPVSTAGPTPVPTPSATPVPTSSPSTNPASTHGSSSGAGAPAGTPRPGNGAPAGGGKAKEVKEFGRLSVAATTKQDLAAPGTLKTIGQMLLDTQAIENIIKHSEAKGDSGPSFNSAAMAKVVSVSRGADIQAMLDKVAAYPGVDGSLVIGKDGLLIAATQSLGMMKDVLGVLGLGIHSTTNLGTKKIDMGELRQSVLRTGDKLTVLTEVGIGVLAVFSDHWNLSALDGMIDHIRKTVTDSQASGGSALPTESLTASMLAQHSAPETTAPPPPTPVPAAVAPTPEPAHVEPVFEEAGEAVVSIADAHGGLLHVNDDDIGGLFDNVLADPSVQHDAVGATAAHGAAATPAPPQQAAVAASGEPVLSVTDEDMSDIFDNLLDKAETVEQAMDFSPAENAAPAAAAAEAKPATPVAEPAKKDTKAAGPAGQQVKEFGRLSASSGMNQTSGQDGAIKAIGRQLIDVQAVENIIKAGEKREKMGAGLTTARVISAARGEGIKALLTKIDCHQGVAGSLIVGNDGLVIASTLHGTLDKDLAGALCNAMHSHADLASKKIQMGKLKQIIFHAEGKCTILTGVAVGVLAVFVDDNDYAQIDSLLNAIESTVRG